MAQPGAAGELALRDAQQIDVVAQRTSAAKLHASPVRRVRHWSSSWSARPAERHESPVSDLDPSASSYRKRMTSGQISDSKSGLLREFCEVSAEVASRRFVRIPQKGRPLSIYGFNVCTMSATTDDARVSAIRSAGAPPRRRSMSALSDLLAEANAGRMSARSLGPSRPGRGLQPQSRHRRPVPARRPRPAGRGHPARAVQGAAGPARPAAGRRGAAGRGDRALPATGRGLPAEPATTPGGGRDHPGHARKRARRTSDEVGARRAQRAAEPAARRKLAAKPAKAPRPSGAAGRFRTTQLTQHRLHRGYAATPDRPRPAWAAGR